MICKKTLKDAAPRTGRATRRATQGIVLLLSMIALMVTSRVPAAQEMPSAETNPSTLPSYVGRDSCTSCHARETSLWEGSHHDLAMQPVSEETVLGDFDDQTFEYYDQVTRFYRDQGRFFVRTDGPEGVVQDFEIKYTFGFYPLQQYLIELPGGRLQAFSIAWDSREKDAGGQRWFHLYPDERIDHTSSLHWSGPEQNWNYMCAECHSTNLEKGYDADRDTFDTTWSEIDVSCEACHGPRSNHVHWAESQATTQTSDTTQGEPALSETPTRGGSWQRQGEEDTARWSGPLRSDQEIETCARCHSRRAQIWAPYEHGRPIGDTHRVSLLEEQLYFPDGQIKDEVYVYGSFIQSKMHAAGVICSDCHEPHSLQLRTQGNGLCTGCHAARRYDTAQHHHHAPESQGAACVECHMPERTYMVVDARRDHSLRIPRPDLSVSLGTPNPCSQCHQDRDAQWAAKAVESWHGEAEKTDKTDIDHYGVALAAGQNGTAEAESQLLKLALQPGEPAIARASALALLGQRGTRNALRALQPALEDPDPLVRRAALDLLELVAPLHRWRLGASLLDDPVRDVRIEATRILSAIPAQDLTEPERQVINEAAQEYRQAQLINAERPEAHLNIGALLARQGHFEEAEQAYRTAIEKGSWFTPAYVNLADLYREQGRDDEGARVLDAGLAQNPDDAVLYYTTGLLKVRQKRLGEAVSDLSRAAELAPEVSRYSYAYAVATKETLGVKAALEILAEAQKRHPNDRELLSALTSFSAEAGDLDAAIGYAQQLARQSPGDVQVQRMLDYLRSRRAK